MAINKVLRVSNDSVSSGDIFRAVAELSRSFFHALLEATRCFLELFSEHVEKPSIISLLLSWAQTQIGAFVEVLSRQVNVPPR
jgi:hypothetical protein